MILAPSKEEFGCLPPVGILSYPMVCGTPQSSLHMALYKLNSELVEVGLCAAWNGVSPNRRQYKVTPSAQISMDLVIWGRPGVAAMGVVELVVRAVVVERRAEDGDCDMELKSEADLPTCSKITSGARNEGVPARRVKPDSSNRIGSYGSSFMSLPPAAASRWAYEKWDTPKSPILTCRRSSVQRRLAGFMSRWMIPWWCTATSSKNNKEKNKWGWRTIFETEHGIS